MPAFLFRMAIQTFLTALLAWSLEFVMEEMGILEIGHSHRFSLIIQVVKPMVISIAGILLGAAAYSWWKGMRASAVWVWAGPVGLLAFCLGVDTWIFGWHKIVPQYFVWMKPGAGEPPLGLFMFVYPAVSALSYSLGAFVSKPGRWSLSFTKTPPVRTIGES